MRWIVEVVLKPGRPFSYKSFSFQIEELEELHDRIERGPDWRLIDKIIIRYNR